MMKGVFDDLATERPANPFTVGIQDDLSHTSLTLLKKSVWIIGGDGWAYDSG